MKKIIYFALTVSTFMFSINAFAQSESSSAKFQDILKQKESALVKTPAKVLVDYKDGTSKVESVTLYCLPLKDAKNTLKNINAKDNGEDVHTIAQKWLARLDSNNMLCTMYPERHTGLYLINIVGQ